MSKSVILYAPQFIEKWKDEIIDGVSTKILNGLKEGLLNFGKWILSGLITNSYWIFLWCAIIAVILYIIGIKKAGKYITISIMLHLIMQMLRVGLNL